MQHNLNYANPALYLALGIATANNCITPELLINGQPDRGWVPFQQTVNSFDQDWEQHKVHCFYCQRDEQIFQLEQDSRTALIEYLTELEQDHWDKSENELIAYFLDNINKPENANFFKYFFYEGHLIICCLDI